MLVFHYDVRNEDSETYSSIRSVDDPQVVLDLVNGGEIRYDLVARIKTDSLDSAHKMTNSIDEPWFDMGYSDVEVVIKSRSTSVGDIIYDEPSKTALFCCPVGWRVVDFDPVLHEEVFLALDSGEDNDPDFFMNNYEKSHVIAEDMISYSANFENVDVQLLMPHVEAWLTGNAQVQAYQRGVRTYQKFSKLQKAETVRPSDQEIAQRIHESIVANIEQYGFAVQGVFGAPMEPPFSYTIGLSPKFGFELIVTLLPPVIAAQIINNVEHSLKNGLVIEPGKVYHRPEWANLPVKFMKAQQSKFAQFGVQANAYYGKYLDALQLVVCDENGKFPGDEGYADTQPVMKRQALLY